MFKSLLVDTLLGTLTFQCDLKKLLVQDRLFWKLSLKLFELWSVLVPSINV